MSAVTEGDLDFGVSVWDQYYRVCPKSQLLKTNPYAHAYANKICLSAVNFNQKQTTFVLKLLIQKISVEDYQIICKHLFSEKMNNTPVYPTKRVEWSLEINGDSKFLETCLMRCLENEGSEPGGRGKGTFIKNLRDRGFNKSKNNFYLRE